MSLDKWIEWQKMKSDSIKTFIELQSRFPITQLKGEQFSKEIEESNEFKRKFYKDFVITGKKE